MAEVMAATLLDPVFYLFVLLGVVLGIVFGAIPVLNTPVAIALVLPVTYSLNISHTCALLMGVFMGGVSGGLISAILINIPGTAAAIAMVLDGHPMAQQGEGARALALGTFVSFIGGIFSAVVLMLFTPVLSSFAIQFGPWEYFGVTLFALTLVITLMEGKMIKGIITTLIGLLLACVGMSPIDGTQLRFTLGSLNLAGGFDIILVVIGLYAFSEILVTVGDLKEDRSVVKYEKKWFYFPDKRDLKGQGGNILRSSIIGTIIGILPGIGATVAGMFSYTQAKRFSKHPEKFGTGCPDGIIASETANNAVTGGALVPMLSLSVPGDPSTAVILGAFMIQGISCGPLLVTQHLDIFQTVLVAVFVANIFMYVVQAGTIRWTAQLLLVPKYTLMPLIVAFCSIGAFTVNNRSFDLYMLLAFSVLGFVLKENDYPLMPMVLAFILGELIEPYYRRSVLFYNGNLLNAFTEFSLGTVFVVLAVISPFLGIAYDKWKKKKREKAAAAAAAGAEQTGKTEE